MDKVAVLIPCYNESKTIEKVIKDFKAVLPDATIYVYIIILQMVQMRSHVRMGLWYVMSINRAKEM